MQYIIASGPVIIENHKILLNKDKKDNFWKIAGGQVKKGESFEETAIREVKEEMGIKIKILRPISPMIIWKKDKVVVLIHYLAKRIGKIKPGPGVLEWKWVDLNHLPKYVAQNVKIVAKECTLGSRGVDKK